MCLQYPAAWMLGFFLLGRRLKTIDGVSQNRMKTTEKLKPYLGFFRNQPFSAEPKNRKAVCNYGNQISL